MHCRWRQACLRLTCGRPGGRDLDLLHLHAQCVRELRLRQLDHHGCGSAPLRGTWHAGSHKTLGRLTKPCGRRRHGVKFGGGCCRQHAVPTSSGSFSGFEGMSSVPHLCRKQLAEVAAGDGHARLDLVAEDHEAHHSLHQQLLLLQRIYIGSSPGAAGGRAVGVSSRSSILRGAGSA